MFLRNVGIYPLVCTAS